MTAVTSYHIMLDRIPSRFRAVAGIAAEAAAKAAIEGVPWSGDETRRVHDAIAKARAWAALQAAVQTLRQCTRRTMFANPERLDASAFFSMPFDEAIAAFIARHADITIDPDDLRELYWERGATATEAALAVMRNTVDRAILTAIDQGVPLRTWRAAMARVMGETDAYWETVYRTNVSQAYSDGQRAQVATMPDVPLLRYIATQDNITRPNHRAAHGSYYATDDPDADLKSPPYGFNCRCTAAPVTRAMARRAGLEFDTSGDPIIPLWPKAAFPDPGFK